MKEFKEELKRIQLTDLRERRIEQAITNAKDMWEITRRLKRSMRNKPSRFTKLEEARMVDWWRMQYEERTGTGMCDLNQILHQKKRLKELLKH
ncbi:unnamed protein product [Blepharisma stoltei]|uniref:Uncharacterized protein n=1 Tax=Blepharisma stoltei TaxID=1481888 RepID=A0AAU9J460_9CILI|nr:unnamed protein product [Blepharisma stoltei]